MMKKLLVIFVLTVLLFITSATLSLFLGARKPPTEPETASRSVSEKSSGRRASKAAVAPAPQATEPPVPSAVRPSYSPGADEAVQLAGTLRDRLAAVRENEDRLAARQKNLALIYNDMKAERSNLDTMRKQVAAEMKAVDDKLATVEKRYAESQQQLQENASKLEEIQKNLLELKGVEQVNVKKMAEMYDTIEPESGARILQQLSKSGQMDTAVELIGQMRERQAAKVLAALPPDSGLAAQILEKLKGFKRPPRTAPAQAAAQ
jgi:septal ring factor EnvC (AmiA/AmiB activator)